MIESYSAAVQKLIALQKHGIKLGLDTISDLLFQLGHPEKKFQSLHIGGTNGKGSTAAILATVLQAMGYRIGLYTSPHLVDFRERIRVQGQCIAEECVRELVARILGLTSLHISPTFFELTTALAFQYFAQERVDIAIVEVGMGGRCDATNVLNPMGVIITNIALDHEAYLGSTISSIAREKAGIMKSGIPVVIGSVDDEAKEVIAQKGQMEQATCYWHEVDFHVTALSGGRFDFQGLNHQWKGLSCSLPGVHQMLNSVCALMLLDVVEQFRGQLSESRIRSALATVQWAGRLEAVETDPLIIVDGAHNPAAAAVLADFLRDWLHTHVDRNIILIVGMLQDKAWEAFLLPLTSLVDDVILTQIHRDDAATPLQLKSAIHDNAVSVHLTAHVGDALHVARGLAGPDDLICVAGSLYLVGEVKSLLTHRTVDLVRG